MTDWTRRQFLVYGGAAPVIAVAPDAGGGRRAQHVYRLRLTSGAPWRELEMEWRRLGLAEPGRLVARPAARWWPDGRQLPDQWQAWVEFEGGQAAVIECRPREWVREPAPRAGFAAGEALAAALRGGGDR
jgi:hypothetical protein